MFSANPCANGSASACPADIGVVSGTVCRASVGICDVADTCNGTASACPADGVVAGGTSFPSTGAEGAFAPVSNTVLTPGVHNYTTINIPAGVTVTTNGSGLLDLRASSTVTIAGTIDLSGGAGGAGAINRGCYWGGGSGGATGNVCAPGAAGVSGCGASGCSKSWT